MLLNKSDDSVEFHVDEYVSAGTWRDALSGEVTQVSASQPALRATVAAHGVRVFFNDRPASNEALLKKLDGLQLSARRKNPE